MTKGKFLLILPMLFCLFSALGFGAVTNFEFDNDLWIDGVIYNYNPSSITWKYGAPQPVWTTNDSYWFHVEGWNLNQVIAPSPQPFYDWTYNSHSINAKPSAYLFENNTWYNGSFVNQIPVNQSARIMVGYETTIIPAIIYVQWNLTEWYDWMYKHNWTTIDLDFTPLAGVGFFSWYGVGYTTKPYLQLNQTAFYTDVVSIENPNDYIYFDFESNTYAGCDGIIPTCAFAEADFGWYKPQNRLFDPVAGSDGVAFHTTQYTTENTLNVIPCSNETYTSGASHYGINAQDDYDVFCFNQSTGHGAREFYGAVKFLSAVDSNLTFYYALYSGTEHFALGNIVHSPEAPAVGENVTINWSTSRPSDSRIFYRHRPLAGGNYTAWASDYINESVYAHSVVIDGSLILEDREYQYFVQSTTNATVTSGYYYFNTTGVLPPVISYISGVVRDATTNYPIAGASITADGYSATADVGGIFSVPNLPAGTYTVTVSREGYQNNVTTGVAIPPPAWLGDIYLTSLVVPPYNISYISGVVRDSYTQRPIDNATIIAYNENGTWSDYSDVGGIYSVANMPLGTYTVIARKSGYEDNTTQATLPPFASIMFYLQPTTYPVPAPPDAIGNALQQLATLLGVTLASFMAFVGIVASLGVGIYAGFKSGSGSLGIAVTVLMVLAFVIFGWIPLWVLIIFAVLSAIIVAKYGTEWFGGK